MAVKLSEIEAGDTLVFTGGDMFDRKYTVGKDYKVCDINRNSACLIDDAGYTTWWREDGGLRNFVKKEEIYYNNYTE